MRVGGVWRDRGVKIETFVTRRRSRTSFGALPDVVDFHSTLLNSIAMHARPYITVAALKLHFKSPWLFAREYHSHHVRFVVSIKIHLLKTQPSSRPSSLMLRVFHRRHALHIPTMVDTNNTRTQRQSSSSRSCDTRASRGSPLLASRSITEAVHARRRALTPTIALTHGAIDA